jgi:hypothetical protein
MHITSYNLKHSEIFTKIKIRKHNSRAAGSMIPTSYTPEDGQLGQNKQQQQQQQQ